MESGIRATGRTLLANRVPPRPIPPGCYDVGDGFYSPVTKCVTHPVTGRILRIPPRSEEKWILENCRKSTGFAVIQPARDLLLDEEEELISGDEISEQTDEISIEKQPIMVDKSVGRFDLLHKKVQHRAYNSKYILIDEMRSRACKKHRLYLPALRVQTKVRIIPDLRLIPPFKCVHDRKALLSNKLVLLLKILKESHLKGEIQIVNTETLKQYKRRFRSLLQEEKNIKELPVCGSKMNDTSDQKDFSNRSSVISEVDASTDTISQKMNKVLSFKEVSCKRSILKVSEHKAQRAKELASMWSTSTVERSSIVNYIRNFISDIIDSAIPDDTKRSIPEICITNEQESIEINEECEVCLAAQQSKIDEQIRKERIYEMIRESEKQEMRRQHEIEEIISREKIIEPSQEEKLSGVSKLDDSIIEFQSIDPVKKKFFLDKERPSDLLEVVPLISPDVEVKPSNASSLNSSIATIIECQSCWQMETIRRISQKIVGDFNENESKPEILEECPPSEKENVEIITDSDTSKSNRTNEISDVSELSDIQTEITDSMPLSQSMTPISDMTPIESDYTDNESEGA